MARLSCVMVSLATLEGTGGLQLLRLVHVVTSHQELPLCDLSNVVAFGYNDVLLRDWWLNSTCVSLSSSYRLMERLSQCLSEGQQ